MKLQNKIGLINVGLSLGFLLLAAGVLYIVTNRLVYREMDEHMQMHRRDILTQLKEEQMTVDRLNRFKPVGSVEWLEFTPVDSTQYSPDYENYETVNYAPPGLDEPASYRRFRSIVRLDRQPVMLTLFEKISGWDELAWTIMKTIMGLLLVWMGLVYAGNNWAFARILSPFYSTVRKLAGVRGPRTLDVSFSESSTDEIDQLHRALNRMLGQLKQLFEQQKEFLQNASHELLTPLTIIRQKTDQLLENDHLDEDSFRKLAQIQETVTRVSRLNSTLLMISRIESNQFELNDKIPLSDLLKNVTEELDDFIKAKALELILRVDPSFRITGNRDLIHALLFNIVQNAIKFSPHRGIIRIVGEDKNNRFELSIADQGPGIPDHRLQQIFKRFKKVHDSWDESPGLGLAIVESICTLHGFSCRVESEPGAGTTFFLLFSPDDQQG